MKIKWFLILGAIIMIFFSIKYIHDYTEKDLDEVIGYDIANFESLSFNEGTERFEWKTDREEHAEKLKDFFSQYRVERMKDAEWDSDVSKEEGFMVTIYSNGKPTMASIYGTRVHFLNEAKYYHIINGPIDIDWVKNYILENQ